MIKLSKVFYKYKNGVHALHDINIEIKDGEFVYVTGKTGCGKTTLIKLLDSEIVPTKGTVIVNGTNVGKLRYSKVPLYRRKIGVVFQEYKLLPKKTVFENVAYALEVVDTPKKEIRRRVKEILALVDLSDKQAAMPDNISGGQRQRVAIARAIVNKPKLLIADEPTGSLDPETSEGIFALLEKINKEEGTTTIVVTHNAEMVRKHPKRTIKLEQGHVVEDGIGFDISDIQKFDEALALEETKKEEAIRDKELEEKYNVE